jgi:ABC-type glycerol-3-phosphate transport system substrate-binding protein
VLRLLDFAISDGSTVKNGAPSLTQSSVKGALDLIGGSVKDGWASSSSYQLNNTDIYNLFAQGRVAMYPGGVFDTDTATAANVPIATAPLPGPKSIGTAQGVGWAYIVPAKSTNKAAAEKLIAFLGKPASMASLTLTFPARVSATKAARFQTELRKPFVQQLSGHSIPAPTDPRWTATIQAVHDDIEQVALGQSTSSNEAGTIVKQANTALGK